MAKTDEQSVGLDQLAAAFAAAMKSVQPVKELTEGDPEYKARQDAEGWFDEFNPPVYQNGYEAQARGLSKDIQYKAAHLKPGAYLKGRVKVEVGQNGAVYLHYPTKGDNLMINQSLWRDFSDLITQIWNESQAVAA
jgi:hypothetical protein